MKVEFSAVIKLRPTRGCQSPITADFRLLERGPESGPDSEGEMKICHKKESMSYTLPSERMETSRGRMWLAQFSVRLKVCSAKRSN